MPVQGLTKMLVNLSGVRSSYNVRLYINIF